MGRRSRKRCLIKYILLCLVRPRAQLSRLYPAAVGDRSGYVRFNYRSQADLSLMAVVDKGNNAVSILFSSEQ